MFDISFSELFVLGTVALLLLGPDKLPGTLRTVGRWLAKARRLMTDLQAQSGIAALRSENFYPTRSLGTGGEMASSVDWSHGRDFFVSDESREYPQEGADANGALPEDLIASGASTAGSIGVDPVGDGRPVRP